MPFTNPILGGTALVRPAINSPNYVPGVAGWALKADGTADIGGATVRGELVVGNAAPGSRVVATRTIPAALSTFYGGMGETVTAALLFYDAGGGYEYFANISGGGLAVGVVTAGGSVVELEFKWSGVSNQGVNMSREIIYANQGIAEGWNQLTLVNGWTQNYTNNYRLVPSPANTVQIRAAFNVPAAARADATTVTTLPAAYWPAQITDIPATCDAQIVGKSPHFSINTNGVVTCWGLSNATLAYLNGVYALDA